MSLSPGARLGPYEVGAPLGAGGMGEVYRARDTKLERSVALKVLPDLFANDPERMARFTREAQTLAALNHPNIAAIYGLEDQALVMELVEGEDLSAVIARGPMAFATALPIARQIADAIEAAHEQGIIHRDLKPSNVKVRRDGTVKVLDFGLAKAMDSESSGPQDSSNAPTIAAHATQMGIIIGTAAYMSPEQARGRVLDRRADIWAFGAIVYEMLTGMRAFEGDDLSMTLASVIKDDPKWTALPSDLPSSVTRLLRRCLEKDLKKRLSSIGDARLELDEPDLVAAVAISASASAPAPRPMRTAWFLPMAAGIALTTLVAWALWPKTANDADEGDVPTRLSILASPDETIWPDSGDLAISPDGTMVAFVSRKLDSLFQSVDGSGSGRGELRVRSLNSMTARRLETSDGVSLPFWSPDSTRIAYFQGGKLKTIAASGGRVETLADAPSGRGAIWTSSNTIVFAPDFGGPLMKVSATGGVPTPATELDPSRKEYSHRFPALLPDGNRFLYASIPARDGQFEISAGSFLDNSRIVVGTMAASPVYAEPGWLLFARQGVLNALPFNAVAMKITGDPIRLEDEPAAILNPSASYTGGQSVSLSMSGALAYYSTQSANTIPTWHDLSGAVTGVVNVPPGPYEDVAISPDGRQAALVKSLSPSESSLWLVDLVRGGASPLSTGTGRNDAPVWSPDGSRLVWSSDRTGPQNIYIKSLSGQAQEELLWGDDRPFKAPRHWSPDGSRITLDVTVAIASRDVYLLDSSGKTPPALFVTGPSQDSGATVSPDGRWASYLSRQSGSPHLYVVPFPGAGRAVQVSDQPTERGWWSRDGRRLTYTSAGNSLWQVTLTPGDTMVVSPPRRIASLPSDIIFITMMPDEQRFLSLLPERKGTGSITVVQNWLAALRR